MDAVKGTEDQCILDMISEIDEPLRLCGPKETNEGKLRSNTDYYSSNAAKTARNQRPGSMRDMLGPTPRGGQSRPKKEFYSPQKK